MSNSSRVDIDSHPFVNRDNERDTFRNILKAPGGSQLPALCFHGPGGVGKTWLRGEFEKILKDEYPDIPWSVIDYRDARFADDYSALLFLIAAGLKDRIPCPEFYTAYGLYLQKSHTNPLHAERLLDSTPRGIEWANNITQWGIGAPMLTSLMTNFPYANDTTPYITAGAGVIALGFCTLVKCLSKAEKERTPLYQKYEVMEKAEIYKSLLEALVNDLNQSTGATQCQSVICFDTVEQLGSGTDARSSREKWIADFARLSQRTLVILTGHDRMNWKDYDHPDAVGTARHWDSKESFSEVNAPSWTSFCNFRDVHLLQYKLHDLKKVYAEEILDYYGVNDAAQRKIILDECYETTNSGYHPFSLALCIETVKNNPTAILASGQFQFPAQKREAIISRYLLSLQPAEKRWIKTLAFTPRFDRDAVLAAFGSSSQTAKDYRTSLLKRCFVSRLTNATSGEWFVMHGNMRNHILDSTPRTLNEVDEDSDSDLNAREAHEFWRDYWRSRSAAASGGTL